MTVDEEVAEIANRVAEEVRGTADSVYQTLKAMDLPEELQDNEIFCNVLDSLVFCCESCDWWCEQWEMSELTDAWVCTDCVSD